ncbi:hypothetical protein M426DRAFT_158967 [Hypoxylon sp. CI-4A]|nr:hypothetical protein M426DRAFT_158967 [Hypoxylon sp. CI-4A]
MNSTSEAVAASNPSFVSGSGNSNGNVTAAAITDPSASSLSSPTIITTKINTATNTNTTSTNQTRPTNSSSSSTPSTKQHTTLHAHRQNHNSSKLPAYRFADLQKEPITIPSLLQSQRIPPSPVSPDPDQHTETQPNAVQESTPQTAHPLRNNSDNTNANSAEQLPPAAATTAVVVAAAENSSPSSRFRASTSTFQTPAVQSNATSASSVNAKRSASLDSPIAATNTAASTNKIAPSAVKLRLSTDPTDTVVTVRPQHRRAPLSANSVIEASSGHRMNASDDNRSALSAEEPSRDWTHGQRELLLPKTIQRTATDERRGSVARRPPVSYKPPVASSNSGGTASIPPIRSFRSSGERRSLVLDMNVRSMRGYEGGDDYGDSNQRDRTLRALEGRRFDDASQITPPDSAGDRPDGDDSGDLFLKIAREDTSRRGADGSSYYGENQSALSRVARSSRRPLSMNVSPYQPNSPPQVSRRLSDQETSRPRGYSEDQSGERIARTLTYRGLSRDKTSDETKIKTASTPLRGSPLTPRSLTFQDQPSEHGSVYNRRRQQSVDQGTPASSRMASLKPSGVNYSHPRTYNSSPLVPKPIESQKPDGQSDEVNHGVEGTNSTASTAAPSTVWDELDDLKSRIHRLELTGKLPPTSGAAISRASDERPPTAHTNATTLSASPKRGPGNAAQTADLTITQKDAHPVLHSALVKSKDFLSPEVFGALETAANDALSLSAMMGIAGQPGPISSGASSIGSGTTITDRQLRRKADSICRSLTELCLALSEGVAQIKPQQQQQQQQQQVAMPVLEDPPVASPTITRFPSLAAQRRASVTDRGLSTTTGPRALSRYEEKRLNSLVTSALPTPRYSSTVPLTPTESPASTSGRKTSILVSRSRRAGTEEPDEGRRSSLLRTRRATTEEPEDQHDRKPILVRGRRGTIDVEDDEGRFRAPSRAITEVHGVRSGNREYASQLPAPSRESESLASSALPRRRLGSTALNTKLVIPATTAGLGTPARRYFDRSTPDRETYSNADRLSEDRSQRQYSVARSGSIDKRINRGSMIATSSPSAGSYLR